MSFNKLDLWSTPSKLFLINGKLCRWSLTPLAHLTKKTNNNISRNFQSENNCTERIIKTNVLLCCFGKFANGMKLETTETTRDKKWLNAEVYICHKIKKYGKTTNNKNITIPIKYENYRGIMFYHFCTLFAGALAL